MMDMLPFLKLRSNSTEGQMGEVVRYLSDLKETLEFALMNISVENLSADLVKVLDELGANIAHSDEEREDSFAQINSKALTIPSICESEEFKLAVRAEIDKVMSGEESGDENEPENPTGTENPTEPETEEE